MLLKDDPHLREVLMEAADLPPDNRQAFLDSACGGDAELRREVQSLLERIDPSNGESVPARPAPAESHPDRIGRYRIIEPIGEGGMGTVYKAEQEHPVRRTVALKLIKLGMDTKQVVARFNAERQALAMMDHPHIAKVFDAGATDRGRPYFVMELVQGVPITQSALGSNYSSRSAKRCSTRTRRGSSTATSSPRTCWSRSRTADRSRK